MEYINLEKITHCGECGGTLNESFICEYCGLPIIEDTKNPDTYFLKIINKLINGTLTKNEEKTFLYLFRNKAINYKNFDPTFIIIDILFYKKLNISYEIFQEIFKFFAINIIKKTGVKRFENFEPRCEIIKLEENVNGACNSADLNNIVVKINENKFKEFFQFGGIDLIITLYHEIVHVIQNINIKLGRFTKSINSQIKDYLIIDYERKKYNTKTYYDNNYENMSFEVHARQSAVSLVESLLSKNGIILNQDKSNYLHNVYIGNPDLVVRKIIVNGEETVSTMDEIFDIIIQKNPEYLELYPQLQVEYINDNGVIRRKNIEELQNSLNALENEKDKIEKIAYVIQLVDKLKGKTL